MKIVDRVKNIFKIQTGEFIEPEKIENVCVKSKYVAQSFVYGSMFKKSLVAIIIPEEELIMKKWALLAKNKKFKEILLANSNEVKKLILKDLEQHSLTSGLKSFEIVI